MAAPRGLGRKAEADAVAREAERKMIAIAVEGGTEASDWQTPALVEYARTGNLSAAAAAAGLTRRDLAGRRKADPVFDQAMSDAKETYLDGVEQNLAEILKGTKRGNPLAAFGILKAHRAGEWDDKQRGKPGAAGGDAPISETAVNDLLRLMLSDLSEEGRTAVIGGGTDPTADLSAGADEGRSSQARSD